MPSRRHFIKVASGAAGGLTIGAGSTQARAEPTTILNGDGVPPRGRGIVGDFYIDDRTHEIYGPKRNGGWGRGTSLVGPAGRSGTSGSGGGAGSAGPEGPAGANGSNGAPGDSGYSILNGSGPPPSNLGVDNDFYIDTSTTQLYGPREGGVWGSPIALTGSTNVALIDGGGP